MRIVTQNDLTFEGQMNTVRKTAIITLYCLLVMEVALWAGASWELKKSSQNINIYTRDFPGSSYSEMMVEGTDTIPFEVAIEVAMDHNEYHTWFGMCKELFLISKNSENDLTMYFVLDMPVVTNRDAVLCVKREIDLKAGKTKIFIQSIESDFGKKNGYVRMPKVSASFNITRIDSTRTNVIYTVHAEMGGVVPAWVVNMASVKHPFDTAVGVKNQARKPVYAERARKVHNRTFSVGDQL